MCISPTWEDSLYDTYSLYASNSDFTEFLLWIPALGRHGPFLSRLSTYAFKIGSRDTCHFTVQKAIIVSVSVWESHRLWDRFQSRFIMDPGSLLQCSLPGSIWLIGSLRMGLLPSTYMEDAKVGALGAGQEEDQKQTRVQPLPWSRNCYRRGYGR